MATQWLQHRQTVEYEKAKEARQRAVAAAEEIDRLLITLQSLVPKVADARNASTDLSAKKSSAIEQVRFLSVHLPVNLRDRVRQAADLLQDADNIARGPSPHYHSVWTITRTVGEDAREAVAAFLRNDPLPPQDEYILEYAVSYDELQDELENFYAEELGSQQEARERWLAAHPRVKGEIETRRRARGH
ncbi:MAG: hypothetical protein ABR613_01620 [Actinomycetota bacterium]